MLFPRFSFSLLFLLPTIFPLTALAQNNDGENSTVVYPAEYFTEYAPLTAQDMIARIPGLDNSGPGPGGGRGGGGFGGNPSSGGRGFGGGNEGNDILINGKRTAGKNNDTRGLLSRIAADQVNEIQIIRGTSGDLDVRGSGQVINVLLYEELPSTSVSYEASMNRYFDDEIQPGGSLAVGGQSGALNYLFSGTATPGYDHSVIKETSVLGDFTPNDAIHEHRIREQTRYEVSMNLGYEINANSSARFNALYGVNDDPTEVERQIADRKVTPNTLSVELEDIPSERNNWEIGGDYEYRTDNGNRIKALFIANQNNDDSTLERFDLLDDGTTDKTLFLDTAAVTEERIVRGSYTMDVTDSQNVEFGVERAQTILDSNLALGLKDSSGTPSPEYGGLVPQDVSNANSRVEEIRYEPFVIHNWVINPRMSLESTLLYEISEITQSGDVSNQRDFDFVKPKLDFRFDVTPTLQLRATVEKVVNQLSFSDFVASNDDQDTDSNTQAGNAQLRQQWMWKYNFRTEYRLPNDVGVLSSDIFYNQHHDIIERIDVSPSEDNLQSANGNIGDGYEYGINLSASVRMGMINLPNLLVTSNLNVQDSQVEDPFLGIDRRFQFYQRGRFTLTFRHDIPQWNMNWGGQYFDRIDGNMYRYDIDDIEFMVGDPRVNLFVEYVDRRGLTYRFDIGGITNGAQYRERYRYDGRISDDILEEIEARNVRGGTVYTFAINGTF